MGTAVSQMTARELATIRNNYLGFVFQGFHLLPRATALANVALPLLYAGVPKQERERQARKALEVVGLGTRLHHTPSQLSGGQQQRVAIARALVNHPVLLLADEPTGNLDSRTSREIMALLQDLNRQGLTLVLVTHEPDIAAYARRCVTFRDGRIVSDEPIARSPSTEANISTRQQKASQDLPSPGEAAPMGVPRVSSRTESQPPAQTSGALSVLSRLPPLAEEAEKRLASLSWHFSQTGWKDRIRGGAKKLILRLSKPKEGGQPAPPTTPVGTNTRRCTHCHAILPSSANFCGICGVQLEKRIKGASTR
jgi:ABC-type lipoprotein export system ATPase subunit